MTDETTRAEAVTIPEGYALVPIEPTEAMVDAATWEGPPRGAPWSDLKDDVRERWSDMLAASPAPQPEAQASGFAEGVEAAAKVAEKWCTSQPALSSRDRMFASINITNAIRALKPVEAAPAPHWSTPLGGIIEARGVLQQARKDVLAEKERNSHLKGVYEPVLGALEPALSVLACLAATSQPSASEVERDAHWLIERRCSPSLYLTGRYCLGGQTSDVDHAARFATKREAQEALRVMPSLPHERAEFFVAEHIWVDGVYADAILSTIAPPRTAEPLHFPTAEEWQAHTEADRAAFLEQYRAAAIASPADLRGWVVKSGDGRRFRTWRDGFSAWTDDCECATRYARRQDAEAVHKEDEDAWFVVPFPALARSADREVG